MRKGGRERASEQARKRKGGLGGGRERETDRQGQTDCKRWGLTQTERDSESFSEQYWALHGRTLHAFSAAGHTLTVTVVVETDFLLCPP